MSHTFPSEDIHPISLFGNGAMKLLEDVQRNHRPVFLTNKGKAAGVLMDIEEYERLIEVAKFRKAVLASEAQADRGEVVSHEQAMKESKRWLRKTTKPMSTR